MHLDIFFRMDLLPAIPLFLALTHLGVAIDDPRERLLSLLEQCPRLQLLLVKFTKESEYAHEGPDAYTGAQAPHTYDVRFVIGRCGDYWADWEVGAKGGADLWAQGDEFVARKRAGEIEATRYWLWFSGAQITVA
ncbi:hypothetical protein B0H14DRAFT_1247492 [Mycena olivaceomarginata]|nr:hypothetical protein B0H14DRAFT_1247492 [Mycena olivaceomarginata]